MAALRNRKVIATIFMMVVAIIFIMLLFKKTPMEFRALTMPHWPFTPTPAQFNPGSKHALISPAHAWVLQVADFKLNESSAANALMQSLSQKGFKSYTRQVVLSTEPVIRVFVGPEIKSAQIKILAERLTKEMQLKSTIITFDPLLL